MARPLKPVPIVQKENTKKNYIKRIKKNYFKRRDTSIKVDYDTTPAVLIKLMERQMWIEAIKRCADYPDEAATWMYRLQEVKGEKKNAKGKFRWKILPVHSAIVLHAPVQMIEALVDAYPQGVQKGDDRNMLPLHMAFRLGASPETAAVLVDSYPDALLIKDSKGQTPLRILKEYKRKYKKEKERGNGQKKSKDDILRDTNRKSLIKLYLGRRSKRRSHGDDAISIWNQLFYCSPTCTIDAPTCTSIDTPTCTIDADENQHDGDDGQHDGNEDQHDGKKDKHDSKKDKHDGKKDKHDGNEDQHDGKKDKHDGNEDQHDGKKVKHDGKKDKHDSKKDKHDGKKDKHDGKKDKHDGKKDKHDGNEDQHDGDEDQEDDGDEDQDDKLFYRGMFTDFFKLAIKGIASLPEVVRDTVWCHLN